MTGKGITFRIGSRLSLFVLCGHGVSKFVRWSLCVLTLPHAEVGIGEQPRMMRLGAGEILRFLRGSYPVKYHVQASGNLFYNEKLESW